MSLKVAAQHLSAKGRGPDDTLVHMSRGEVKSLNDLAMAHGGQLTINPETGLPEAGFLTAMLPMLAGMALAPATGGASLGLTSAWQTAALVGAGAYALNPKGGLMGGLKAGLGAYGGAGLGEALAQQGMEQAASASLANQPEYLAQQEAIKNATTNQLAGGANALSPEAYADQMRGLGMNATNTYNTALTNVKPTDFMGRADMLGQGVKSLGTEGGFSNLTSKLGGPMGTATKVASALSPALLQEEAAPGAPVVDKDLGQRYTYSPGVAKPLPAADVPTYEDMLTKQGNFGKQQNYYPNQGYTKVSSDEAKNIYGFANGGPVEQMSNNAMMGVNTMYPMANMSTSAFATPYQNPVSTNMIAPTGDSPVGMNGEPSMQGTRMAEGGEATPGYTYDAQAQKYISSAPTAPMNAGAGEGISSAMGMTYNPLTQQFTGGNLPTGQIYLGGGQYGVDEATKRAQAEAAAAAASDGGYAPGAARGGLMDYADGGTADDGFLAAVGRSFGVRPLLKKEDENPGLKYTYNPDEQQYVQQQATGGIADAGYNLGGYSDGGRLLRGPGDGVSDSIPAVIGKKQPARLADGEFVVPARIVSEIGNGSTEAGARKLYGMMDRVQAARGKTVSKGRVAKNTRADKYLPA